MGITYFAVEAMGILIVLLLLYATIFEVKQHTRKKTVFIWLLVGNLIVIAVDAITWLPLGREKMYSN